MLTWCNRRSHTKGLEASSSSFTWARHSHLPEQPGDGVPSHCPSCTSAKPSAAPCEPPEPPLLPRKGERPLSDQDGSGGVQLLPSFPQPLCQNGLSRRQMTVEGLLWHLQLSCWLPFCILLLFGMSQWQMCQADGSWLGQPSQPPGQTRVRQDKAPLY